MVSRKSFRFIGKSTERPEESGVSLAAAVTKITNHSRHDIMPGFSGEVFLKKPTSHDQISYGE